MIPSNNHADDQRQPPPSNVDLAVSRCADWLSEGEARVVEFGDLRVVIRYVGRKGRRGRVVIEAPAGAAFS